MTAAMLSCKVAHNCMEKEFLKLIVNCGRRVLRRERSDAPAEAMLVSLKLINKFHTWFRRSNGYVLLPHVLAPYDVMSCHN